MNRNLAKVLIAVGTAALVIPFAAGCMNADDGHRAGDPGALLPAPKPPEAEAAQLAATPPGKQLPLRDGGVRAAAGVVRGTTDGISSSFRAVPPAQTACMSTPHRSFPRRPTATRRSR